MATKKIQILDSLIKQAENADTLDGKHAEEFALSSEMQVLQNRVGDEPVADQITKAIAHKTQVVFYTWGEDDTWENTLGDDD